jgi:HKD family nuclease
VRPILKNVKTYSNYSNFDSKFTKGIAPLVKRRDCREFIAVVGYVGQSMLQQIEPSMLSIAKRGVCQIIVGMIEKEGASQHLKDYLESLDQRLRSLNASSGIFVTPAKYHGKIYKVVNGKKAKIFVGSSNFSKQSWSDNGEFNICIDDSATKLKTLKFIAYMQNLSIDLSVITLKVKTRGINNIIIKKDLKDFTKGARTKFNKLSAPIGQFDHTLRVEDNPASGLNLYFEAGRFSKKKKTFKTRNWFEVELATNTVEQKNKFYPPSVPVPNKRSPSSKARTGDFTAYIEDGKDIYEIPMKVGGDSGKNIYSANDRNIFGKYIKGKLQNSGALAQNKPVTEEVLQIYGRNTVTFKKIDNSTYIIDFLPPAGNKKSNREDKLENN